MTKKKKKKKGHQKFWRIKRKFFKESLAFFRKSPIFSWNFAKTYRNLTLGFLGFFYWPILGFQFLLSGNTGVESGISTLCFRLPLKLLLKSDQILRKHTIFLLW